MDRQLIKDFRPEKFPALAKLIEGKKETDLTALEGVVVEYANTFRAAAETAAAELAEKDTALQKALIALRPFADRWDTERDMLRMDSNRPAVGQYKRAHVAFEAIK